MDCWFFAGYINRDGYGEVFDGRKRYRAHRVMYENMVGPIPAGLVIDHICNNRSCINPSHLRAVTHAANIMRGKGTAAKNRRKIACPKGHLYDEANTIILWKGWRRCKACYTEGMKYTQRRRAAKKRAAKASANTL